MHSIWKIRSSSEEDAAKQAAFISLITLTKRVLDTCMDLLGMESPEHM